MTRELKVAKAWYKQCINEQKAGKAPLAKLPARVVLHTGGNAKLEDLHPLLGVVLR